MAEWNDRYRASSKGKETTRLRAKSRRRRIRMEALTVYGGACACCGEVREASLQLDHVGGGGEVHRRTVGTTIYEAARREGWPPRYRVLCANCNRATSHGRLCPHDPAWVEPEPRWDRLLKEEMVAAYGGACSSCGESRLPFLEADHVDGGGKAHMRSIGMRGGSRFWSWLKKQDWPPLVQVLCANCNTAKYHEGRLVCGSSLQAAVALA